MRASLVASVAVKLLRESGSVVIPAGDPLPDLSAEEARDLVAAGALADPPTEFSSSSEPEEARAGAGNPGTNTIPLGPAVASVEGGTASVPPEAVVVGDGGGVPLPELGAEHYAPDAAPLDTSPARPDESVPELVREQPSPAACRRTKAQE